MEKEIIAAEIYLSPVNTAEVNAEIDTELAKVEEALKQYTCTASMLDYAASVISGILAGAIDMFLTKETPFLQDGQKPVKEQINEIITKATAKLDEKTIKPIPKHVAVQEGIPALIGMLEKNGNQASVVGLSASVIAQMARGGMLQPKEEKIQILPDDTSKGNGVLLIIIAVIVGVLKWLSRISADKKDAEGQFKTLDKIRDLIKQAPAFSKVVNAIEEWQKQLPNEIKSDKEENKSGITVERVFGSFFMMLGGIPVLKNTSLEKAVSTFKEAKKRGLDEVPIVKALTRQAFPVLVNEILVRTFFFATRLAKELSGKEDVSGINWENVRPYGNRDIDRMLALSTMTLSVADTADAAIHAAIDSGGNAVLFATRFVTRFNFVAAGRAALAVVKEVSNEKAERELIHMKRILTEAKTANALEILLDYQRQLEERVSEYLAEDIQTFLEGFNCMDQGIAENNSDLVIRGNIMIQRVLGREPQFTNQQEFDDLMDSDMPLKL